MDKRLKDDDDAPSGDEYRRRHEPAADRIPAIQWVVAALGLAVTLATIGYLVWLAGHAREAPPDVVVRVDSVYQARAGWAVTFTATNRGDRTAESVVIRARTGDGQEEGETTLDFVPGHGQRQGGLIVREDPRGAGLGLAAEGWARP